MVCFRQNPEYGVSVMSKQAVVKDGKVVIVDTEKGTFHEASKEQPNLFDPVDGPIGQIGQNIIGALFGHAPNSKK